MAEFRTDPGDRGVSELEREVNTERERVSATIDELRARASGQHIVDQVVKAVAENGGEVSRNLGRSLRENPLAAALTGVGLAWLMAGSGRSSQVERWDDGADDAHGLYGRQGFRGSAGGRDEGWATGSGTDTDWVESGSGSGTGYGSTASGLGSRASDAATRIGEGVSDAVEGLQDRAAGATESARAAMHQAGDAVRGAGDAARRRAASARRGAAHRGSDLQDGLDTLIREQPLVLGAIALALGAAIGGALPRSRVEDRMMGAQSDRVKSTVRDVAEEQGARLQAAAGAVAEEALDIADETAAEVGSRLPPGETLVDAAEDRILEAGSRLRDAAEREDTTR